DYYCMIWHNNAYCIF
nr:immunoglobulin light chain junction region [Macaca mulatta]